MSEQSTGGSDWDGNHVGAAGSISLGSLLTLPSWKSAAGPEYKHHFFRGAHVECNKLILTHSFNFHLLTHHFSFWLFYPQKGCFIRHGRRLSTKEDVFMMLLGWHNSSAKTTRRLLPRWAQKQHGPATEAGSHTAWHLVLKGSGEVFVVGEKISFTKPACAPS